MPAYVWTSDAPAYIPDIGRWVDPDETFDSDVELSHPFIELVASADSSPAPIDSEEE